MPLGVHVDRSIAPLSRLDCFVPVRLRAEQRDGPVVFPVGTRGVVVDRYDDETYGIEFSSPAEDVVIVKRADLEPV